MAMKIRQSLIQLLKKLVHGTPHFIRCLRRSKSSAANVVLDKAYLAEQIRSCNLVETIKIRQNGYAYRIPFIEFLRRYLFILPKHVLFIPTRF
jgi:myosin-3